MTNAEILTIVTMLLTWILGIISKKCPFIKNELIPIQNIAIGVVMALIYFAMTKDFNNAIALSGLLAGGVYDIFNNLIKIFENKAE